MKPIEGLAASVAAVELRKAGHPRLADAVEADFQALRDQRDQARDLAVHLEQLCAEYQLGFGPPEKNGTQTNA